MSYVNVALANAAKGYPIFPCQPNKRPKAGLNDWENVATTDEDQILAWWAENPDYLPAVPPGRVGCAVIDVDQHEGKENGFDSLDEAKVQLATPVFGTSISGNGKHFWFRENVGSVNGIYPGVDRKAQGGYVVVPYDLPDLSQVTSPLPEELKGGIKASNVERKNLSNAQLNTWLYDVGEGNPDDEMWEVVERFLPRGNQQMSVSIARVVSLAAQGHPGASVALDRMQDIWLSGDHSSGDPEEEFLVNVRSAIEKFGERAPDTSADDKWNALLGPKVITVNLNELWESLLTFCARICPDWDIRKEETGVKENLARCQALLAKIQSVEDVTVWRERTQDFMKMTLA